MKFCRPWDCDFWRWFVKGAAACRGFRPALIAYSRAPIGWIPRSGSQPSCAKREETRERLPRPLTFPAQSVFPQTRTKYGCKLRQRGVAILSPSVLLAGQLPVASSSPRRRPCLLRIRLPVRRPQQRRLPWQITRSPAFHSVHRFEPSLASVFCTILANESNPSTTGSSISHLVD